MIEVLVTMVATAGVTALIASRVHAQMTELTVRVHTLEVELSAARNEASNYRDRVWKADEATRRAQGEYDRIRADYDRLYEENKALRALQAPPEKAAKAKGGRRR